MIPNKPLVVRERDANGKPTAFGWTPLDVLDEPPNLDNIRPDWKALLKIIPAYKEYKEIAASLHNRYDQSMAQRKLVEDPDARFLRAKIWTLKCKGEYEMGNFDRLPKNDNGAPFVPPMPDRSDFSSYYYHYSGRPKRKNAKKEGASRCWIAVLGKRYC